VLAGWQADPNAMWNWNDLIVFTIWQAAHKDESSYMCCDVIFE
jgi:hypothetical protein